MYDDLLDLLRQLELMHGRCLGAAAAAQDTIDALELRIDAIGNPQTPAARAALGRIPALRARAECRLAVAGELERLLGGRPGRRPRWTDLASSK